MRYGNGVLVALGTVAVLVTAAPARSAPIDFISAYGWVTPDSIVSSSTGASQASLLLANCHGGAGPCTTGNADVTFVTSGIDFSASGATIQQWLNSSAFSVDGLVAHKGVNLSTQAMDGG